MNHLIRSTPALSFIYMLVLLCSTALTHGSSSRDSVLEITAITASTSPHITLTWSNTVSSLSLYRRVKGSASWDTPIVLASGSHTYTDSTALAGIAYEYSLAASSIRGGIVAGYNIPMVETQGRVILLVDNTVATALAPEIDQLQKNLVGDGWSVYRHDVPRAIVPSGSYSSAIWAARIAEQQNIRAIIQNDYNTAPDKKWALLLLGRIPQPYSGKTCFDGHTNHMGAWPTDLYYADINGTWSDSSVDTGTTSSGLPDRSYNLPGDGKFDTDTIPSDIELQCGRIDLSNMPGVPYGMSETELLRQYLVRNNNFRRAQAPYNNVARRGIIDDHFGFAAESPWCNGFSFFGRNPGQTDAADWFSNLSTTPILYAFGGGSGTWTSAYGVGDSVLNFGTTDSKAVFTQLFGSYFGDWDCANNFLRAPLAGTANSLGLTCIWVGIPLFHMGLGDPIGYSVREAQNNFGANGDWYNVYWSRRGIHIGLMGDPTLRLHSLAPPQKVTATSTTSGIAISWVSSADPTVTGYHIYRSTNHAGPFTRITGNTADAFNPTGSALSATTFNYTDTDSNLIANTGYTYLVKAVKMETSASGSYANQSVGEAVTITHLDSLSTPTAPTRLIVTRINATTCVLHWDDNATDETAYLIERCDPTTMVWSQITTTNPNITTYTDTNVTTAAVIYYRVRAVNANGNSSYSNEATDYNRPGIAFDPNYQYLVSKTAGTCSPGLTRFNGTAGAVNLAYATTGFLGTEGTDYTATTSTVTWSHGSSGVKSLHIPIPNPPGTQLTKIFQVTYSSPTNGLVLGKPLNALVFIYDTDARALPSPWSTTTFGNIVSGGEGYAECNNGVCGLAVQSSAIASWATSDSGRFLYQQVIGDFTFSARLAFSPNSIVPLSMGGIAVRADLTAGAVMDSLLRCYSTNIQRATRATTSRSYSPTEITSNDRWMRIVRSGNAISCYRSANGTTWSAIGSSATLSQLPSTAYIGFILSSVQSSAAPMAYAQFDNITLTTTSYPAVGNIDTFTAASGTNTSEIILNWSEAIGASTYQIERSTLSNSGFYTVATVTAPTLSYTDNENTDLVANTTYYYRVMALNPLNHSPYTSAASAQPYLPPTLSGWRYLSYATTKIYPNFTGDLDAPAGDGITNLMKYALGIVPCDIDYNPVYTNRTSLPVIQTQVIGIDQYLTCTFTHNKNSSDAIITVEVTGNLNGDWTAIDPLNANNQISVTDNFPATGLETIVVKDTQPFNASSKRFMRFRVTH